MFQLSGFYCNFRGQKGANRIKLYNGFIDVTWEPDSVHHSVWGMITIMNPTC